ncbi:hypothetical protein L2U69_11815 [Zavarzinia compransoris]|uniref:hypothetical protein n=1 Tax=Zavarzinia marina TaxID=2911065 RepID=UPI001F38BD29|nr:hypothetical protein [Zavarzinia marina]MCF4166333.1 hypothetical protein [Zavarzinia marina]
MSALFRAPVRVPIIDQRSGGMASEWVKWFDALIRRVGEGGADNSASLQLDIGSSLSSLAGRIGQLEAAGNGLPPLHGRDGRDGADGLNGRTLIEDAPPPAGSVSALVSEDGPPRIDPRALGTGIEYGTFTPSISFDTPGDLSVGYAGLLGRWWRFGDIVRVYWQATFTPTFSTASGNFRLQGFPFAQASTADGAPLPISQINLRFAWPAGTTQVTARSVPGDSYYILRGLGSGISPINFTPANLTSGTAHSLWLAGIYPLS